MFYIIVGEYNRFERFKYCEIYVLIVSHTKGFRVYVSLRTSLSIFVLKDTKYLNQLKKGGFFFIYNQATNVSNIQYLYRDHIQSI